MTREQLLLRGYCCGLGCVNCPYEPKHTEGAITISMRLLNIYGKLQSKNVSSKLIDWNKKSRSKLQFKVKQFLKKYWENHIVYEEFPVYGTRLSVDIVNATKKIAVEVNGPQHSSYSPFFHKSRQAYLDSIKRDNQKAEWLKSNNFILIEIEEKEVEKLNKTFIKRKFKIDL